MTPVQTAATPDRPTAGAALCRHVGAQHTPLETCVDCTFHPRLFCRTPPLHFPPPAPSFSRLPRNVFPQAWNISKDKDSKTTVISKNHPTKQGAGAGHTKADLAEVSRNAIQISHVLQDQPMDTNLYINHLQISDKGKTEAITHSRVIGQTLCKSSLRPQDVRVNHAITTQGC